MPHDDDLAMEVDEFLDELTELLVIPVDSPTRATKRAILLRRPSLIVLPEGDATLRAPRALPVGTTTERSEARRMRLTPFAPRAFNSARSERRAP